MKPTLTFSPIMFGAAMAQRKTITRRVALVSTQNQVDMLAEAISKDDELTFWNTVMKAPYGPEGTQKPMVTGWAVQAEFDNVRPSALPTDIPIWFDDGTEKPAGYGKKRQARFFPSSLYHRAPQVVIESTRAEMLCSIFPEEALKEGIFQSPACFYRYEPLGKVFPRPLEAFFALWDSINETRHQGLYTSVNNPVVWRIEFKLL